MREFGALFTVRALARGLGYSLLVVMKAVSSHAAHRPSRQADRFVSVKEPNHIRQVSVRETAFQAVQGLVNIMLEKRFRQAAVHGSGSWQLASWSSARGKLTRAIFWPMMLNVKQSDV